MALPRDSSRPINFSKGERLQVKLILILFPSIATIAVFGLVVEVLVDERNLEFIQQTVLTNSILVYRDCLQDVRFNQFIGMTSEQVDSQYELCMSVLDPDIREHLENPNNESVLVGEDDLA